MILENKGNQVSPGPGPLQRGKAYGQCLLVLLVIISLDSCLLFKPKTAGLDSIERIEKKVDSLTSDAVVKNLSEKAAEGAVSGLATKHSEEEIEKLGKALGEVIAKELTGVFQRIDTRTPGTKFAKGVTDSLINKQLEADLLKLIHDAVAQADGNLEAAIKNIETNVKNSLDGISDKLNYNVTTLEDAMMRTLSKKLQDSLSGFLTTAISDVQFKNFSTNLSTELLSREFRDTLGEIVLEIREKVSIDEKVTSYYKIARNNFVQAAIFIALLVLVVTYLNGQIKKMGRNNTMLDLLEQDPELKKQIAELIKRREK